MKQLQNLTILALLMPLTALADPIITTFDGPDAPGELGGYTMTDFADPTCPLNTCPTTVSEAASPIDGSVLFQTKDGDSLDMTVYDPDWWGFDHGNVYTTDLHWVELIMPAYTNAFSFFVGASFTGSGWIEAYDSDGNSSWEAFSVGPYWENNGSDWELTYRTPGFGVHTSDACSSITKIIVEPYDWGIGEFAINQGQDNSCVTVPEPAPIGLIGIGLLAMALSRKFMKPVRQA